MAPMPNRTALDHRGPLAEALAIHDDQIERYGGSDGARDPGLLEAGDSAFRVRRVGALISKPASGATAGPPLMG
jgi:hypothetical protein